MRNRSRRGDLLERLTKIVLRVSARDPRYDAR